MSANPVEQARELISQGNFSGALDLLNGDPALSLVPEAHSVAGLALMELSSYDRARERILKAVELGATDAPNYYNLGICNMQIKQVADATEAFQKALALDARHQGALLNLGLLLREQGKLNEAISNFKLLLEANTKWHDGWIAYCETALAAGQATDVLEATSRFLRINSANAFIFHFRGLALEASGNMSEARETFLKALKIDQNHIPALRSMASLCYRQGDYESTISICRRLLIIYGERREFRPAFVAMLAMLVRACRFTYDWERLSFYEEQLIKISKDDGLTIDPWLALTLTDDPEFHQRCARGFWPHEALPAGATRKAAIKPANRPDDNRITIGYAFDDHDDHSPIDWLRDVIAQHDKSRFRVLGFKLGSSPIETSEIGIISLFDKFHDCAQLDAQKFSALLRDSNVDVLIDIIGPDDRFFNYHRSFSEVPLVGHVLPFPGTHGEGSGIDFIISDQFLVSGVEPFLDEKVVRLPGSAVVLKQAASKGAGVSSRQELGLPEKAFVFSCFTQPLKLSPSNFKSYLAILKQCPGSVLWLLDYGTATRAKLGRVAELEGISKHRLVFAPRLETKLHRTRYAAADLILDTWPLGALRSASDALASGVPILTRTGSSVASRVTGSLLAALDLEALIGKSDEEFVKTACALHDNPERLRDLRSRLASRVASEGMSAKSYCMKLEAALEGLVSNK